MIVTGGLGRSSSGATGIIVAAGLGLVVAASTGGATWGTSPPRYITIPDGAQTFVRILDDLDLLEIVPIIVEIINGRR